MLLDFRWLKLSSSKSNNTEKLTQNKRRSARCISVSTARNVWKMHIHTTHAHRCPVIKVQNVNKEESNEQTLRTQFESRSAFVRALWRSLSLFFCSVYIWIQGKENETSCFSFISFTASTTIESHHPSSHFSQLYRVNSSTFSFLYFLGYGNAEDVQHFI